MIQKSGTRIDGGSIVILVNTIQLGSKSALVTVLVNSVLLLIHSPLG